MKLISAIPIPYSTTGSFWSRDLGLVTLALRDLGIDAWFVALEGDPPEVGRPLLTISRTEMANPTWWKQQNPDAIILNTWSAPRHHDIRLAALSLNKPLIEKLDTDGVKSPRIYPVHNFRRGWVDYDLTDSIVKTFPRRLQAFCKSLAFLCLPALMDERMVHCMSNVGVYAAETPLAAARVRRFLRMYAANPMPEVVTISHPVDTSQMGFEGQDEKQNQIISVGRWDDAVKGWPLLRDVAIRFLKARPDWKMVVAGGGAEKEGRELEHMFPAQFSKPGRLDHDALNHHLRVSKIYLLPSHSETFNIAGAEALCSGCSVVGPSQIPSSSYFASKMSGTTSHLRTPDHVCDALLAEVDEWECGRRDPAIIASSWQAELSAPVVAKKYLEVFSRMGCAKL